MLHIYTFLIVGQQGKINGSSTLHLLQQMYLDRYGYKLRCCSQLVFSTQTARLFSFFIRVYFITDVLTFGEHSGKSLGVVSIVFPFIP